MKQDFSRFNNAENNSYSSSSEQDENINSIPNKKINSEKFPPTKLEKNQTYQNYNQENSVVVIEDDYPFTFSKVISIKNKMAYVEVKEENGEIEIIQMPIKELREKNIQLFLNYCEQHFTFKK